MADAAKRQATYEDLLAVPEHLIAEILDGQLVTQPRPAARHSRAASRLGMEIGYPFDRGKGGPGGWSILFEPELHLNGNVLVPELAGWRRERMPSLPDAAAFELPPDWACEVLSPSTQAIDRVDKTRIYAQHGVPWLWLVDPLVKTLEILRLEGGHWIVHASFKGEAPVRAEPFDAVELDLAALWER